MMRIARTSSPYLLFGFAILWPWDVYECLPWLGVHGTVLIGGCLAALLVLDIGKTGRLRMPFEFVWPAVLLLAFILLSVWRAVPGVTVGHAGVVLVYFATVHFTPSPGRIAELLRISCLSAACAALWTIVAAVAGVPIPTAYSLDTRGVLWFAHDLPGGALTLLICGVLSAHFAGLGLKGRKAAGRPGESFGNALIALVISGALLGALALVLLPPRPGAGPWRWEQPGFARLPAVTIAALVILLWIIARVVAKAMVHGSFLGRAGPDARREAALGTMIVRTLTLGTVFCLCFPVRPTVAHAFLLGLAAAWGLPEKGVDTAPSPWRYALGIPCAVLIGLNILRVDPANASDPRNYEVAAKTDFKERRLDDLARRLDIIEEFAPGERRTHLLRAQLELSLGHADLAAREYGHAVRPVGCEYQVLPPPTKAEGRDLLVRLRDFCSSASQPERLLAYERALIEGGDTRHALDSLRHRAHPRGKPSLDLPTEPFAGAIAFLLGDQALGTLLGRWSAEELLALLKQWGAHIERAPEGFPPAWLPVVLAAQVTPVDIGVWYQAGAGRPSQHRVPIQQARVHPAKHPKDTGWAGAGWTPLVERGGGWAAQLRLPGGEKACEVCLTEMGGVPSGTLGVARGSVPAFPALRVYIP